MLNYYISAGLTTRQWEYYIYFFEKRIIAYENNINNYMA